MTRIALVLAAVLAAGGAASAQDYPNHVITIVSPFPAGGPSDTAARLVQATMSKVLGQQIVIENVTGAGGTIGTTRVARAAPDGYTLLVSGSGTLPAAEFLFKSLPYKTSDFEQIGLINLSPMVMVARKGIPANTLAELTDYIRKNEKSVTEADAGVGSISNLACAIYHSLGNVNPTVASYRGTPQATLDLVAGNVDFGCNQIINVMPHIKSGALKALAVTSDVRSPLIPDVPTAREAGMPGFNLSVWFGISAPKGTPKAIVEKLSKALSTALDDPETVKRFGELGYDVPKADQRNAAYFDKMVADEVVVWRNVLGNLAADKKL